MNTCTDSFQPIEPSYRSAWLFAAGALLCVSAIAGASSQMPVIQNIQSTGDAADSYPQLTNVEGIGYSSSSTLTMQIGGTVPGSEHDKVVASYGILFGGTLDVLWYNGYQPAGGEIFDLFDAPDPENPVDRQNVSQLGYDPDTAGFAGEFDTVNLPALPGGLVWDASQLYIDGSLMVNQLSAALAINPPDGGTLAFGPVLVGGTPGEQTVTVTNTGDAGSMLNGDFGGVSGDFAPKDMESFSLAAGEQAQRDYLYTPSERGTDTDTLDVTTDADDGNASINLTGQGVAPQVELDLAAADAGFTLVGLVNTSAVTVRNVGDGNLSGEGAISNLRGQVEDAAGPFSRASDGVVDLTDSAEVTHGFQFAPTLRGAASQNVNVAMTNGSDDGTNQAQTLQAELSGTGVAPIAEVDSPVLDAGKVRAGDSGQVTLSVTNAGDGNLSGLGDPSNLRGQITAATDAFAGGGSAISLPDNENFGEVFTFAPTVRGPDGEQVTVSFDNGNPDETNSPYFEQVQLLGEGVGPVYESTPAPGSLIDFGQTENGVLLEILTVRNATTDTGTIDLVGLTLLGYEILGPDAWAFALIGLDSPVVLDAAGEVDLTLRFSAPGDIQQYDATLRILTDQNAPFGGDGDDFEYDLTGENIPEPASMLLIPLAIVGVFGRLRRSPSTLMKF